MRIAVIGTGYVGLVTGTCFAETGNTVTCVDIDAEKVKKLSNGEITIFEPSLEKLFLRNLREKRLKFTTDLAEGIETSELIILALPTPPGGDGSADLSAILKVSDNLGKILKEYKVIVDKSTVPVGTAEKVHKAILANCKTDFDVVSNPEFLREGLALEDFMKPDRVIIGTSSERAKKIMSDLYAPFVRQGNPVIFMDERSAELTKYAANSFLATKISFMNEIAILCEKLGADVDMVRRGMGSDDRIGRRFLFPGVGYGGSCFPKDVRALARSAHEADYDFKILDAVMQVNEKQKVYLVPRVRKYFKGNLKDKNIAMWGLSFKPNTDDIREAPALYMIDELLKDGAKITAFDPESMNNVRKALGDKINFASGQYEAIANCDGLIIATEWSEFRTPDFEKMSSLMKNKVIFDGRNIYEPQHMKNLGFYYESIGRKTIE
ncbi:MAG TPA: UDP-glucose/GDP-mannose dehydrogenase family protein [Chitinophagaceae bacterium]|nr:UDP-glucose/GDP-mannose dehydrogenase family protein [Chitinophagaceae bacterium]